MRKDDVLAICVAIQDCSLIDIWEDEFHRDFLESTDMEERIFGHRAHYSMWRAALLFSLISLRKVADFAEDRGMKPDDLRIANFGLSLAGVTGETMLIDDAFRARINKGIAHLTLRLDPDQDEMQALRDDLRAKSDILEKLGDKFFAMAAE